MIHGGHSLLCLASFPCWIAMAKESILILYESAYSLLANVHLQPLYPSYIIWINIIYFVALRQIIYPEKVRDILAAFPSSSSFSRHIIFITDIYVNAERSRFPIILESRFEASENS